MMGWSKMGRFGRVVLGTVQAGCILHCITKYGVSLVVCSGHSMEPTIYTGDVYLVESVTTHMQRIKKGDIVVVQSHVKPEQFICKRIVGLEGDRIENTHTQQSLWVPRGHVWLEGDNKQDSRDSREYGALPYGLVRSRLWFKVLSSKRLDES